jgi:DNA-directed RNA polymerase beta subunit
MDDLMDGVAETEMYDEDAELMEELVEITSEDAWVIIDKYFNEKGLVRQQTDSFDEFIINTIQELIDDSGEIVVTPENQYIPGQEAVMVC